MGRLSLWLVLIVGTGLAHGHYAGRFRQADATASAACLARLQNSLGTWQPGQLVPIDSREIAFQTAAVHRVFTHLPSQQSVVVSLTAGRPAVVAAHSPEVCYVGSGYRPLGPAKRIRIGSTVLWRAEFQKNDERLRIYWGWCVADGRWQAPETPRWQFARETLLYKLYIVHPIPESEVGNGLTPEAESSAAELLAQVGQAIAETAQP